MTRSCFVYTDYNSETKTISMNVDNIIGRPPVAVVLIMLAPVFVTLLAGSVSILYSMLICKYNIKLHSHIVC